MAGRLNIQINAGDGQSKKLVMAGVVTGGVDNEYKSQPKSEGLKSDLSNADIKLQGPGKDAGHEDVKMLGLVEGGLNNKVTAQDTDSSKQGQ